VLVGKHHLLAHKALELRPSTLLELLEQLDAFRRPERFEHFRALAAAVRRGRGQ